MLEKPRLSSLTWIIAGEQLTPRELGWAKFSPRLWNGCGDTMQLLLQDLDQTNARLGPELTSRHFLAWAFDRGIRLVYIQPRKPTQNAYVESFNGKLSEKCLRVSWFQDLFQARRILARWRQDHNHARPHSRLGYSTPAEFAALKSAGKDAGFACLENALGVSHFPNATAAVS